MGCLNISNSSSLTPHPLFPSPFETPSPNVQKEVINVQISEKNKDAFVNGIFLEERTNFTNQNSSFILCSNARFRCSSTECCCVHTHPACRSSSNSVELPGALPWLNLPSVQVL